MATTTNLALPKGSSKSKLGVDFDSAMDTIDKKVAGLTTVTFSATPAFDASLASAFLITLTANVTSSTITNPKVGQRIALIIKEDGTGGRTFAFPANVKGATAITTTANLFNVQEFLYDGTSWLALDAGKNYT